MVAGEESAPPPRPAPKLRGSGEAYVEKMVNLFINPSLRERLLYLVGEEAEGNFVRRIWKGLTSRLESPLDSANVGLVFEAEEVADVVRTEVIHLWIESEASNWNSLHKGGNDNQSDAGGEGFSKSVKLEALAIQEKVDSFVHDGQLLDCDMVPALDGSSGSRSSRGKHASCSISNTSGARVLLGTQPVCVNAHESVEVNQLEVVGPPVGGNRGKVLGDAEGNLRYSLGGARAKLPPVTLGCPLGSGPACGGAGKVCSPPACTNAPMHAVHDQVIVGSVNDPLRLEVRHHPVAKLDETVGNVHDAIDSGGDELIAGVDDLAVEVIPGKGDVAGNEELDGMRSLGAIISGMGCGGPVLINEVDGLQPDCRNACEEDASDFRPPAAGVGFQEWVKVATVKRKGNKMRSVPANVMGEAISAPGSRLKSSSSTRAVPACADTHPERRDPSCAACEIVGTTNVECLNDMLIHPAGINFSWKNLLRTAKPDVEVDLHYMEPALIDGEHCAVFSPEEEAVNMACWQHTLLYYVVGMSPTYFQFLKAVNRLWNPPGGIEVFLRENGLFYCRFACAEDMSRVINYGPWYMDGKLLVVKKFSGATNCEEEMLSCIPIWINLPGLPVKWWSISGVSKVVSTLGHPLYFDIPSATQSRISYARCCVEVAMEKTLPECVTCIGGDKVKRRQRISYEWVPKKCSGCKQFGHLVTNCRKEMKMDDAEIRKVNERVNKTVILERENTNIGQHKGEGQQLGDSKVKGKDGQQWVEPKGNGHKFGKEGPKGVKSRIDQGDASQQTWIKIGMSGSMYKANVLYNKLGKPIKATHSNAFQPLSNVEEVDPGDFSGGSTLGKHSHFCSDDEDPCVEEDPKCDVPLSVDEDEVADNENEESEGALLATSSLEESKSAQGEECVPIHQCCSDGLEGKGSGNLEGKVPTTPGEPESNKSTKKKKWKRKTPAPHRPEGSRTTHHSGSLLL